MAWVCAFVNPRVMLSYAWGCLGRSILTQCGGAGAIRTRDLRFRKRKTGVWRESFQSDSCHAKPPIRHVWADPCAKSAKEYAKPFQESNGGTRHLRKLLPAIQSSFTLETRSNSSPCKLLVD